jgi:hypothetical protein
LAGWYIGCKEEGIMENREREVLKVLFATRGNIKTTAGILGVPETVVRRYLRRRDFCRGDEGNLPEVIRSANVSRTSADAAG